MFFKRKQYKIQKKQKQTFKSTELQRQKMPIVTLDNSWHQLVAEIKTPQIEMLEKDLTKLLKEQGKLNTDYIQYTKMKKEMLDSILELTHEALELKSEKAAKKIEDQQKMILKINENLEQIEERLDIIPKEIQEANSMLVDQSVQLCYGYINNYKAESQKLDDEIQIMRSNLMKKTEKKKHYDKRAEQIYQYLHQLVGPGFIEKLDNMYWEKSE